MYGDRVREGDERGMEEKEGEWEGRREENTEKDNSYVIFNVYHSYYLFYPPVSIDITGVSIFTVIMIQFYTPTFFSYR